MAPERAKFVAGDFVVAGSSKESDVFSFAMTSFSVCPFWKPSYYLMRSSCYDQVLTGVLPYHGSNWNIIASIRSRQRPSRPRDPSQNRLLQRRVWRVITTGWIHEPEKRCELSNMHRVFSTSTQWDQGDSNTRNSGDLMIAKTSQTPNSTTGTWEEDHLFLPVSAGYRTGNPEAC